MDMYVPLDEPAPDAVPVSGMNQELLSKAKHLGEYLGAFSYGLRGVMNWVCVSELQ